MNSVIQRASSLVFDTVAEKKRATAGRAKGELFYGRRGTLTHFALQDAMTELEGGAGCVLYPLRRGCRGERDSGVCRGGRPRADEWRSL
ncbi:Cystathionine beta-lyase metC [Pantoea agglomerans]|uniref:Cystathionine beta-lyase metC n=1 Tax=Enterobacter agglomerans TaxID=549 RepID=A0A379AAW6_ENTAG|nr:Cystathionine beta-lyase metC [Pantoea agglomerans]